MQVTRPVFPARQLIAWGAKQPERTEMADGNRGRPTRCGLRRRIWLELGDRVERGAWGCAPERRFRRSRHLSGPRAGADGDTLGQTTLAIVRKDA